MTRNGENEANGDALHPPEGRRAKRSPKPCRAYDRIERLFREALLTTPRPSGQAISDDDRWPRPILVSGSSFNFGDGFGD